jgi:hypothetical protein
MNTVVLFSYKKKNKMNLFITKLIVTLFLLREVIFNLVRISLDQFSFKKKKKKEDISKLVQTRKNVFIEIFFKKNVAF